jgi:serine/threonine protein kinase
MPSTRQHSTLRQTNILINSEGHAQISDFGLVVVGTNTKGGMSATNNAAGTAGFMSPEQFKADNARKRTTTDDVYSFGGLCYFVSPLYTWKDWG